MADARRDSSKFKGQLARLPKGRNGGSRRPSELCSNIVFLVKIKGHEVRVVGNQGRDKYDLLSIKEVSRTWRRHSVLTQNNRRRLVI